MSEPDTYGAGTIGIVSYRFNVKPSKDYDHQHEHDTCVSLGQAWRSARLIYKPWLTRLMTATGRNLAFTCCEIGEQTGSASETKHSLLRAEGSARLNSFTAAINKIWSCF